MKKVILTSILLLLFVWANTICAQTTYLSQNVFDLGEISLLNEDVVDFNLSNQSSQDLFLLRINTAPHVSVKYTSKNIPSKSAQLLRIKLNPSKTGNLNEKVELYLSSNDSPIVIEIKAKVIALPKNRRTACPDFRTSQKPQSNLQLFQSQPIGLKNAFFVEIIENENQRNEQLINSPSEPENITDIRSERALKKPSKNKKVKKTAEERRNSPSIHEILFGKPQNDSITKKEASESEIENVTLAHAEKEETDPSLLDNSYKPNNVVFLIDASTSMREDEKMDLLKQAMIELLEPLRSIDYLSIITYSGEANVLLPPTSAIRKEEIKKTIENISAEGSTQAVKGIKRAILVGKSNFIENGNNQIILATDGAFDIGERNKSLRRKIQTTSKEGLTISVLGIKNEKWTNRSLKEIVDLGAGVFIRISRA